jgi:DNA transposition AAA+ family ATPase
MITLEKALEVTGLSQSKAAEIANLSKTTISLVIGRTYTNWQVKERQIIEALVADGLLSKEAAELEKLTVPEDVLRVDPNKFIPTENTMQLDELANDLLDPATTLNASIGLVYGHAGYGKTTAVKHYCATADQAVYLLYITGDTLPALVRQITKALGGQGMHSFEMNKEYIRTATCVYRKLLVVDEADRIPLRSLEALRGLNEYCELPMILVGENALLGKMSALPRLESRIRNRPIEFRPMSEVDVQMFYYHAVGLDLAHNHAAVVRLLRISHGDFRIFVNDAHRLVGIMNSNGLSEITKEVIDAVESSRT